MLALQVFSEIEDHTIISWTSIVMGLAKHGFATRALKMFQEMLKTGIKPNELGACQVHGNTEVGKNAAKMIIKQEPNDPAAYILLSNLHASSGQWDEVVRIKKNMKERNLVKETGNSWIETENRVYKFHVGDTSHPQAREIYEELHQLSLKIKELGYVPNTNFVLHNVEEEQKEQCLFQHSEKIAMAFGLISTSKSKPIKVFKNLRVCGDCHTVPSVALPAGASSAKLSSKNSDNFSERWQRITDELVYLKHAAWGTSIGVYLLSY
ncbi:hypothetical protein ACSBR1_008615 [Camellia fascicularis]